MYKNIPAQHQHDKKSRENARVFGEENIVINSWLGCLELRY